MDDTAGATGPVTADLRDSVLVVTVDPETKAALTAPVRRALLHRLANRPPGTQAVVLASAGRRFPSGADLADPDALPTMAEVLALIEALPVPVVAALAGAALGDGLELALAAHGRVAGQGARMGLPAVGLGLVPATGGTQRLPRLVGAEAALRLMLSGRSVTADEALRIGLVDRVADDPLAEAVALARDLATRSLVAARDRREGLADARAYVTAVATARAGLAGPLAAPGLIIDCVEAGQLLPFDQGLMFETAMAGDAQALPETQALRAAMLAERRLAQVPVQGAAPVTHVLICGGDPAGCAAAVALLSLGLRVTLASATQPRLMAALERIGAAQEAAVTAGRMSAEARDADWARLNPALADEPADEAPDLVLLAGRWAAPGAEEPVAARGGAPVVLMGRAGGARAGLNLWPGRLAEVMADAAVPARDIATLTALLRRMDRVVLPTTGRGVVAPMTAALVAAARRTAELLGAGPVAQALRGWSLVVDGIDGTGPAGATAQAGHRMLAGLANAGLRLVGDGVAARPADIDLALIHGLGWPRHVPGPMLWADGRGMLVLRADLKRWMADDAGVWTPAPLVERLVHDGVRLSALDD